MIYQQVTKDSFSHLLILEQALVAAFATQTVVENALILGDPKQAGLLDNCSGVHHYLLCENHPKSPLTNIHACVGRFTELPYAKETIDCIILPHILEYDTQAKKIIEQAVECLSQRGILLIFSLLPLNDLTSNKQNSCFSPPAVTKHWLSEARLEILTTQYFFPKFLATSENKLLQFANQYLAKYLPFLNNAYLIVAKKNIAPATLISIKSPVVPVISLGLNNSYASQQGNTS